MARTLLQTLFARQTGKTLLACSLAFAFSSQLAAQVDNRVVRPNYEQADLYSSTYLRQFVYDTSVRPNWIGETDQFWYSYRDSRGTRYERVNPEKQTREPLFDRIKLSSQLSEMIRKPLDPAQLSLSRAQVNEDGTELKFVAENTQFKYVFATEKLEKMGAPEREAGGAGAGSEMSREEMIRRFRERREEEQQEIQDDDQQQERNNEEGADSGARERRERAAHRSFSPDRTAYVFAKGHDLYLVEVPEAALKEAMEKHKALEAEEAAKAAKKDDQKDGTEKDIDSVKQEVEEKEDSRNEDEKGKKNDGNRDSVEVQKSEESGAGKVDDKQTDGEKENAEADLKARKRAERKKREAEKKRLADEKGSGEKGKESDSSSRTEKSRESENGADGNQQAEKKEGKTDGNTRGEQKKEILEGQTEEEQNSKQDSDKKRESDKVLKSGKDDLSKVQGTDDNTEVKTGEKDGATEGEEPKELPIPDLPMEMDDTAIRLTEDGLENYSFAGRVARERGNRQRGGERQETQGDSENPIKEDTKTRPSVTWTKNSKTFYVQRRDSRGVKELWVINSLANPRPTLEKYDYAMPGEENVRKSELHYCNRSNGKLNRVEPKWVDEGYSNIHFSKDEAELRFLRRDRLLRNIEICSVNLEHNAVQCLLTEGFENANIAPQSVRYLDESGDMIWWSERSGWGHFYLYDKNGELKNAITSGEFLASSIVDVDEKNSTLYFRGSGREPGENVYYTHLYAVQLDGSGLRLMDPGDANHTSLLSKSKRYLIDNYSRVDLAPASVLRSADGSEIMKLETSDLSRLEHVGWKIPETFTVKAADGVTDLYGNMWKPFDFDPAKKYPVIAHVYPGPQMEGTQHTFSATSGNQQMAQLGFIVIQVGHRGGSPGRGKAYASYGYKNLRDYGLADKKAAIEQLAQRFSYVDVQRVGIYGHSGGGFMTAAALLVEPYNDFFKVGVSTAGNHDNNIYNNSWSERYHGLTEVVVDEKSGENRDGSSDQRGRSRSSQRGGERQTGSPDAGYGDYFYEYEMLNEDDQFDLDRRAGLYWNELDPVESPALMMQQELQEQRVGESENMEVEGQKQEERSNVRRRRGNAETSQQGDRKEVSGDMQEKTDDSGKRNSDSESDGDVKQDESGEKEKSKEKAKTKFEIYVPTNAELAANLKGHLLLVHGELDNNVHPANTLRLVDALIKANKRFDMLYLPATRHGFGAYQPYVTQRMYEFFTEHLMDDYQSGANINEKVPLK